MQNHLLPIPLLLPALLLRVLAVLRQLWASCLHTGEQGEHTAAY